MAETTKNVFKKRPSAAASRKKLMDTLKKERIKNTTSRAGSKKVNASSDTLTQRMGDARKSRGPFPVPAVRKENAVKPYNEPKRDIVKYEEPKRGVVKYEPNAGVAASNLAKRAVGRSFARMAGPIGALVSMTTPAGEGSDKPKGPLMKGNAAKATDFNKAYQAMGRAGMDRPYDVKASPKFKNGRAVGKGEPHAAGGHGVVAFNTERTEGFGGKLKKKDAPKKVVKAGKSATRIAFEKEFAKNRAAGKKTFSFRGKSYNTKLAK